MLKKNGKQNTIILIHGRGTKPSKQDLETAWKKALFFIIKRDHPSRLPLLEKARIEFVYYGHYSNTFLNGDKPVNINPLDRQEVLDRLVRYRAGEFTEASFKGLPGYPPRGDNFTRSLGALAQKFHLGTRLVELAARDIKEYWNDNVRFGKKVRHKLLEPVRDAMARKDRIMVMAHSLGTVIAYDAFWILSRSEKYRGTTFSQEKIDFWLTMGSPLSEETARQHLQGAKAQGMDIYPANVRRWLNLCAHEDYICGRRCLAESFQPMLEHGLVESLEEKRIYNLAVREGRCSPHNPLGYLMHPETSHALSHWLTGD
ncbi:MAG: hypothetical protein JEZ02_20465 [Desulfatibacillum sp.]|nr:hypothetical protein [Desulfatibacillum sp.]